MAKVKTLGEAAEEEIDDPVAWVKRSREMAARKAKELEQAQAELEASLETKKAYTEEDVKGLVVKHDMADIGDNPTILTLEDRRM